MGRAAGPFGGLRAVLRGSSLLCWHAVSCADIPRSSSWLRWKAENFLLRLKKNPDEKNIFFIEKFYFEKKNRLFFQKTYFSFFFISKLLWHFWGFFGKNMFFWKKKSDFFFQNKISPWKKNIFRPDFFLTSRENSQLSNATNQSFWGCLSVKLWTNSGPETSILVKIPSFLESSGYQTGIRL